jgi:hypothetical protein
LPRAAALPPGASSSSSYTAQPGGHGSSAAALSRWAGAAGAADAAGVPCMQQQAWACIAAWMRHQHRGMAPLVSVCTARVCCITLPALAIGVIPNVTQGLHATAGWRYGNVKHNPDRSMHPPSRCSASHLGSADASRPEPQGLHTRAGLDSAAKTSMHHVMMLPAHCTAAAGVVQLGACRRWCLQRHSKPEARPDRRQVAEGSTARAWPRHAPGMTSAIAFSTLCCSL